jgi:1,2-dihydroxy-3-keto-5-methylthiopentene dioxygenase
MGEEPDLRCIRLFTNPEGWVAKFTGNAIAKEFPTFEEF